MTALQYLKSKINTLVLNFPTIKCSYEFDNFDNSHTIEILPSSIYNSPTFYKTSMEVYNEFTELFPFEGLFFIDDKVFVPIQNPIYQIVGKNYFSNKVYNNISPLSVFIPYLKEKNLDSNINNCYLNVNTYNFEKQEIINLNSKELKSSLELNKNSFFIGIGTILANAA
ncbi:MAG: hypothetical protein EAZ27_11815 [Cytophagales bacterium]|nr:MAG: hypothetical protein EAZ27_11815 [Cytophagales bacterium]